MSRELRRRDVDVLTSEEDRTTDWDDERLLERAAHLGRIVFTQDDDFLVIGHQWQNSGREFAGIAYAHQLRITVGQAIHDLELMAKIMTADEMRNRIEFLPIS
jgi:hypothetical protein